MKVSLSAYYEANFIPNINLERFHLKNRIKTLFEECNQRIGSRQIVGFLQSEGIKVSRYLVRKLMKSLNLHCLQRKAKPRSKKGKSDRNRVNLLNQCFNPPFPNEVWAGDITYLKTAQGYRYLAVVMDLYSRRIVGWKLDTRMTSSLVIDVLQQAYSLRHPQYGCVFHSDQGSQYTSDDFQNKLLRLNMRSSMSGVGSCYDNAVVERFFGTLKSEAFRSSRLLN